MDITEKIVIIPNIHYLHTKKKERNDFSKLSLSRYHKIRKSFEFLEISGEIEIVVPEFVLYGLISLYKRDLENEIKSFNDKHKKLKGFTQSCEIDVDIDQHCKQLQHEYLEILNIIDLPQDKSELFDEVFRMAINKEATFVKAKKSDQGFENTIMLLSTSYFAKELDYDKYILILNEGFEENISEIQLKFSRYSHQNEEKLKIKNENEFEHWFNEEYGLYVELRGIIDEKFIPEVEYSYNNNAFIQINHNNFLIDHCDFIKEQTRIYQESENKFEVEVYFSVDLNFIGYHPDELYGMEDMENITQREVYMFEKIDGEWSCMLCDYDYSIYYEPYDEYSDEYFPIIIREKFDINMPEKF